MAGWRASLRHLRSLTAYLLKHAVEREGELWRIAGSGNREAVKQPHKLRHLRASPSALSPRKSALYIMHRPFSLSIHYSVCNITGKYSNASNRSEITRNPLQVYVVFLFSIRSSELG